MEVTVYEMGLPGVREGGGSRGAEGAADRCPLTAASDARTERPTASAWRAAFLPEALVTPDAGKPVQPLAAVGW